MSTEKKRERRPELETTRTSDGPTRMRDGQHEHVEGAAPVAPIVHARSGDPGHAGHAAALAASTGVVRGLAAQFREGAGGAGDEHERHADAVAERVVRGESAEPLLDAYAGGVAVSSAGRAAALQPKAIQFIGTPLDQALPADAAQPEFGEDEGHQR